MEIREIWGLPQKLIDPIKLRVCYKCKKKEEKILDQFKIRLNDTKDTRKLS
ncbi:MAG: hypothetical protein ACFE8E_12085 [Candidatus Hodarchaeota archaeon]